MRCWISNGFIRCCHYYYGNVCAYETHIRCKFPQTLCELGNAFFFFIKTITTYVMLSERMHITEHSIYYIRVHWWVHRKLWDSKEKQLQWSWSDDKKRSHENQTRQMANVQSSNRSWTSMECIFVITISKCNLIVCCCQ